MVLLIQYTLIFSAVLILVALGGMFSERSGIINLGLEGIMVFGAMAGGLVMVAMADKPKATIIICTLLAAALAGMLASLLIAVACINFKADQTLIGTALNMLSVAAATVIVKGYNTARSNAKDVSAKLDYVKGHNAFVIQLGKLQISWFVIIALVLLICAIFFFYKTKLALRIRACGEHPQAADSVGINVYAMRYIGVLMSGFLGGLGGIIYIAAANSTWHYDYGVAGAGFLALAVMIFGQWKPERIAWAAVLFALFRSLSNVYMGIGFLHALPIPGTVYNMFPYIVSLLVLAFTSQNSRAPKAEGIPYDKGAR